MSADQPVSDEALSYGTCLQLWEATQRLVHPHLAVPRVTLSATNEPGRRKTALLYTICQRLCARRSLGRRYGAATAAAISWE